MNAAARYSLGCPRCGQRYEDDGMRTGCDRCTGSGTRVILEFCPSGTPSFRKERSGLQKYGDFLPGDFDENSAGPLTRTIKSNGFARKHGFENLYFTCTGSSTALGIEAVTASFKELEAICVLERLRAFGLKRPLVLSSAGNTARAFAYYAAKYKQPVLLILPLPSRRFLWLPDLIGLREAVSQYVRVAYVEPPGKYLHASMLARHILTAFADKVMEEGGYFNVGRVCGLGTCALSFYEGTGRLPDHYVQAVGSGAGVLGVLRAYTLLEPSKACGVAYHLIQNAPYDPLVKALNNGEFFSTLDHYRFIDTVCSPMLTSGDPAYDYPGGLREAKEKGARLYGYSISNNEIYDAHYELGSLEGIQVLLPAAAAVAGLLKARQEGKIRAEDIIQVNITGCGEMETKSRKGFFYVKDSASQVAPEHAAFGGKDFERWLSLVRKDILDLV